MRNRRHPGPRALRGPGRRHARRTADPGARPSRRDNHPWHERAERAGRGRARSRGGRSQARVAGTRSLCAPTAERSCRRKWTRPPTPALERGGARSDLQLGQRLRRHRTDASERRGWSRSPRAARGECVARAPEHDGRDFEEERVRRPRGCRKHGGLGRGEGLRRRTVAVGPIPPVVMHRVAMAVVDRVTAVVVHGPPVGVRETSRRGLVVVVVRHAGCARVESVMTKADTPRPRRLGGDQQEDKQHDDADAHGPRTLHQPLPPPGGG